uniref:Putative ovule protein n=1 Tax=Solanum chacoense TaxID=4108 RepID=A0A0V0I6G7_SOLCH
MLSMLLPIEVILCWTFRITLSGGETLSTLNLRKFVFEELRFIHLGESVWLTKVSCTNTKVFDGLGW